jgi:hypothetical protein
MLCSADFVLKRLPLRLDAKALLFRFRLAAGVLSSQRPYFCLQLCRQRLYCTKKKRYKISSVQKVEALGTMRRVE